VRAQLQPVNPAKGKSQKTKIKKTQEKISTSDWGTEPNEGLESSLEALGQKISGRGKDSQRSRQKSGIEMAEGPGKSAAPLNVRNP